MELYFTNISSAYKWTIFDIRYSNKQQKIYNFIQLCHYLSSKFENIVSYKNFYTFVKKICQTYTEQIIQYFDLNSSQKSEYVKAFVFERMSL